MGLWFGVGTVGDSWVVEYLYEFIYTVFEIHQSLAGIPVNIFSKGVQCDNCIV